MDHRGNYFMPNNGQIGFSPLHMLGLSTIHPKSMQHGFLDVSVNTHTVDNNFSLFKCKDQNTEIVNMKNNVMNQFGCGLPVGNRFSKLIGGFIGSKCLIGSSTGRENNFWGTVLQQYNSIMGTNNNLYISVSAMNSKENTEYIKAGAVDAALLFSQSFDLFNTNNFISQDQTMGTTKNVSSQEPPPLSVEMQVQERVTTEPKQSYADLFNTNNFISQDQTMGTTKNVSSLEPPPLSVEVQVQERVTTEPKQSYAEVTKSRVASKSSCNAASDRCNTSSKRLRSVRRNPVKLHQKKQTFDISSNNNWRYGGHHSDFGQYTDSTDHSRERRRKHGTVSHDNQHKSVTGTNSTKGTSTPHTSEDNKMSNLRTRHVRHSASNRKLSGKRKLNSNLLTDIKEDCLGVDDKISCEDVDDKISCEEKGSFNYKFSHSPNKWTAPTNQRSPSNRCANWRCRPYSLCDPCKRKDFCVNDVPDCCGSQTQCETVTFAIEQKENDKEINVPETPATPLTEGNPDDTSAKPISCTDSSLSEYEIIVSTRCPVLRKRISSVCSVDSEDSFVIMFDASGDDSYEETSSETASMCSDSDSSDDDDDDDDDASSINSQCLTYEEHRDHDDDDYGYDDIDEIDFNDAEVEGLSYLSETELKEANARWESAYEDIPLAEKEPEKVQFAKTSELTTVHKIIAWDFAYRAARLGTWELLARDRIRFHRRIEHMNRILSPVLQDQHRRNMWQKFHKDTLVVP